MHSTRYAKRKRHAAAKYERIAKLKDVPCMDCGTKYPAVCMDFDHRDPAEKSFTISRAVADSSGWEKIITEIAKCDVVCSNCHRLRTWMRSQ